METLPEADRERFATQCKRLEVAKNSAEFFGRRPRRFAAILIGSGSTEVPQGAKIIHFIRHGEGHHNVWRAAEFKAGRRPFAKRSNISKVPHELFDPRLTEIGRAEAKEAQAKAQMFAPQLLVTSPLRRAVETGLIAFESAVAKGVPCIAHELCREEIKGSPPGDPSIYDAHLPRSVLAAEFPRVDFMQYVLPPEEGPEDERLRGDPLWWHSASPVGHCRNGESDVAFAERAWSFICWLMSQEEKDIAVATHSLFLLAVFHGALDPPNGQCWEECQIFRTGELRSVAIVESAEPSAPSDAIGDWGRALVGGGLQAESDQSKKRKL